MSFKYIKYFTTFVNLKILCLVCKQIITFVVNNLKTELMSKFFKLIRLPNLAIIALVMYAMRYGVIYPFLQLNGFEIQFSEILFIGLVLSTILIAAGGYAINDYEDRKIDAKNNPEKVTEENQVCAKKMMTAYNYLTIGGITIGGIVSYFSAHFMFTTIFVLVAGLLWFYSSTYKMMPFLGNLIIALLAGIVPVLVALFEIPQITEKYRETLIKNNIDFMPLLYFVLAFGVFSFLSTIIREIVKDIEDLEGDEKYKKNTIPVALGILPAKIIAIFFTIVTIWALIYAQIRFDLGKFSLWYILIGLVFPFSVTAVKLLIDKTPEQYHKTSLMLKLIMLVGIGYSLILFYSFTH